MIERELNAVERHVELLVDIAMTPNHPKMLTLALSDAVHVFNARKDMAALLLRIAIKLEAGGKP